MNLRRMLVSVVLIGLCIFVATVAVDARQDDINDATRAVVRIHGCDVAGCSRGLGSGVIIDPSGIILTANHVTLRDPLDPNSDHLSDFVIELTEDIRDLPVERYRARLAASDVDADVALLEITSEIATNRETEPDELELPALPLLADADLRLGVNLDLLGYPLSGGNKISYESKKFSGYDDSDTVFRVTGSLGQGHSGGPALVERDGALGVAGIVIRQRDRSKGTASLIRSVEAVPGLVWTPGRRQAWLENVKTVYDKSVDGNLHLSFDAHGVDLTGEPLRLIAYAFDATSGLPYKSESGDLVTTASGQLVLTQKIELTKFVDEISNLSVTVPLVALGTEPQDLTFRLVLWHGNQARALWHDERLYRSEVNAIELKSMPTQTETPLPTFTVGPTGTATESATETPDAATATPTPVETSTATTVATKTAPPVSTLDFASALPETAPLFPEDGLTTKVQSFQFVWSGNVNQLPPNYCFEVVFWVEGEDPATAGSIMDARKTCRVNEATLPLVLLPRGNVFHWDVLIVKFSDLEAGTGYKRVSSPTVAGSHRFAFHGRSNIENNSFIDPWDK